MKTDIQRKRGQFYTPTLFVDYAHDMISKEFGEDWKEKYVVWDNSAGSKNLTRDYYFNELYSSTLEQAELDISKHYNKEAVSFQFDFLNDSLDKLPKGLIEAFEQNKPIIFFMNPPYAGTGSGKAKSKAVGTIQTAINVTMKNDGIGASSQNLYGQFLYRIHLIIQKYKLTDAAVAFFSPTNYLTGSSWKGFRRVWLDNYHLVNGCMFKASHFADVADNWGIAFSVWKEGKTEDKNNFPHTIVDNINGNIEVIASKNIYNLDGMPTAREWIKTSQKTDKVTFPNVSSGLVVREKSVFAENGFLGYFYNKSNCIYKNSQDVALFSAPFFDAHGVNMHQSNFTRCTSLFVARKLVENTWSTAEDEYLAPDTTNEKWQEFENDSIVYSLFSAFSQQSSLRNIDYKGKKWDIKNEFFWMSKEDMLGLSEEFSNDDCYNDARVSKERYVYELLEGIELSEEAQAVLDKAREIVRKTFKYRKLFNEEHENYQINNWDASYYQMKPLWKEYAKEDFEQFKELYKKLSEKMLPMVYELGFLKR